MNAIKVYNSLTQRLEDFTPWNPPFVKMYCCGPTVYGLLHVGNFRGAVFYHFLRNFLEHEGYRVTFVYNFTDVDDKIIDRARKESVSSQEISERYIREFWEDFHRLKLKPHDVNPKVTETIPEIIQLVEKLVKQGLAYVTPGGDVYYAIEKFPDYGKLSHRRVEDMLKGVRIEPGEQKQNPLDFALWKASKPGEPAWKSPWGEGRPGWHIECSAMIAKHLGEQIDIHGGGIDLLFPHHENEIAQSEGAHHKTFVKYWVHNNLIQFHGAKMSKSLGNIITAREFFQQYDPEIYKFMVLSVHYRSILDLGEEAILRSIHMLSKIYSSLSWARRLVDHHSSAEEQQQDSGNTSPIMEQMRSLWNKALEAGRHDFNSALMISHGYEVIKLFNQVARKGAKVTPETLVAARGLLWFFSQLGSLMSLFQEEPDSFLRRLDDHLLKAKGLKREHIDAKVSERALMRKNKMYREADQLRQELVSLGIAIHDYPNGDSEWEVDKSL